MGILSHNLCSVVSQYSQMVCAGSFIKSGNDIIRQHVLVYHFMRFPVDDFSSVIGQDESAELVHPQFIG